MDKRDITAGIIDGVLKIVVAAGSLSAVLIAPNILQALDKPVAAYLKKLDKRAQEREIKKILYYMRRKDLITSLRNYEHGIRVTDKGKKRLEQIDIDSLSIPKPKKWDKKWRLVFYDIPEKYKSGRNILAQKLKELGFYHLQRSVLVHPYPCREEIAALTAAFGINKFVSYIETDHIDQEKLLIKKFRSLR